jgi:hypothetical protein
MVCHILFDMLDVVKLCAFQFEKSQLEWDLLNGGVWFK